MSETNKWIVFAGFRISNKHKRYYVYYEVESATEKELILKIKPNQQYQEFNFDSPLWIHGIGQTFTIDCIQKSESQLSFKKATSKANVRVSDTDLVKQWHAEQMIASAELDNVARAKKGKSEEPLDYHIQELKKAMWSQYPSKRERALFVAKLLNELM